MLRIIFNFFKDFEYKNVEVLDLPDEDITTHFPEMFNFMQKGLNNGATLVHW